jgi:exodeoxyribonuclease V gamma subunit
MAVTVTSAQRSESLLEALVTWLCDVPDDPFEPDLVIVPTLGVKDWLRSELAAHLGTTGKRDGVVANVRFQLSGWLNHEAIGLAGDLDPRWNLNHLPWSVLAVLHRSPGKMPGFKGSDQPLSQARHVADLFDRYATHRPAMLRSWLNPNGSGDHDGTVEAVVLDDDHLWQPALFRALRAEIDAPSPAELLAELPARLSGQASSGELPRRLALFGLGTITPAQADVLAALAVHCDIRILAHLPSRSGSGRHPLTQAWGGSASPTSDLLSDMAVVERIDLTPGATDSTLLERLQAAVDEDADRPPPVASASTLGATGGDGSIQIHACHGTTRQVEALRDALLHLIRADPTLTARDVIVVCPDLRRFAPLIEPTLAAVFDRPGVTAALADRSLARLSPVAAAIDALFRFAIGRASVEDFFSLLDDPVISSAMGLDDHDHMDSLHRWFEVLHMRWGLDAGHRQRWGYPQGLEQGTWSEAVDQLLAGVLAQAPDPVEFQGGIVPHDDVDEKELEAVGLLAQAIERVRLFADQCAVPHPLDGWCDVIEELVDNLLKVEGNDDRHRRDLMRLLTELRRDDAGTVDGVLLGVRDVANLFASRLSAEATNIRLRTGNVTVASPKPLRGVPARVVAVVGFDDEAIRAPADDGDDLLVLRPQIGERSRLLDHRRGFLDLVLGARDHLLVTCDGWDVTTGLKVPLAGHLARLLEAAQAEAEATGGGTRPLLVEHTRHLADRANLDPKADGPAQLLEGRPWTHDPNAPRIVKAMDPGQATVAASGSSWAVGSESPEAVDLDDVASGVRKPGEALLHRRLGVSLPKKADQSTQEIDLWPDGLTYWELGQDLLDRRLRGRSTGAWRAHHRLLGDLPPEALGEEALDAVADEVKELLDEATVGLPVPDGSKAVEVNVGNTVVRGHIPVSTELLLELRFVRWHPSHHLEPWLRLALATLADPDIDWEAVLAFRGREAGDDPVVHRRRMRGTGEERLGGARRSLETVIDLDRRARSDVIPLFHRYSWSLMFKDPKDKKEPEYKRRAALEKDLTEDKWTDWLHPDTTLEDLEADTDQNHPADVNLPTATFRAERYAKFLYDAWYETTEEVPPPPVGGAGNGKAGGGGHSG